MAGVVLFIFFPLRMKESDDSKDDVLKTMWVLFTLYQVSQRL